MPHDEKAGRLLYEIGEGIGCNAGAHLGAFFHLASAAAEEGKACAVFDDGLVAASRERQLHRGLRGLHGVRKALGLRAEADADGCVDAGGTDHIVDLIRDAEFPLLQPLQMLPLHHEQIAVAVVAAQDAAEVRAPAAELVLHRVAQIVLDAVGLVFHQLVQIVDDDDAGDGAGVFIQDAGVVVLRGVHPIGDAHEDIGARFRALVAADKAAVEAVFAAVDLQKGGIDGLALQQPASRKLGHQIRKAGVEARAGLAAHPEKLLIPPDDTRVLQLKDRDGQRKVRERVALGVVRLVETGFHIGGKLFFPASALHQIENQQKDDRPAAAGGEDILPQIRGHGRDAEQQKNRQPAGPHELPQSLIQANTSSVSKLHVWPSYTVMLHYTKKTCCLQS